MDLEFFVLDPPDPEAFTLRWGTQYSKRPDMGRREDRDLVQLRRAGAGCYTVVVLPRRRGAPPALVEPEQDGRVLRIRHSYGEDLVVFGDEAGITTAAGDVYAVPISCTQTRGNRTTVTLGPAGKATIGGRSFETRKPIQFPISSNE